MPISRIESGVAATKSRLIKIGHQYQETIAAGGTTRKTFTPPKGKIWEIITMYLDANSPAGSASGTHEFEIFSGVRPAIIGRSTYNSLVLFDWNVWVVANSAQRPSTEVSILLALTHIIVDTDNPLIIDYNNDTNVQNVSTLEIWFYVRETPIT